MRKQPTIRLTWGILGGFVALASPLTAADEDSKGPSTIEIETIVSDAKRNAEVIIQNLHDWKSGKERKTTYMGIVIESVPDVLRDYIDLPKGVGLLLTHISEDGPAMKAGLEDNDIITSFDGQIVINFNQLTTLIDMKGPGASVPIKVLRKGEELQFTVVLEERIRKGGRFLLPSPPAPPAAPEAPEIDETGSLLDRVEEWIPGSVQIYIDDNQQVQVDLQDLKNNLQDVRLKLLEIRETGAAPEIIKEFGDLGARTSVVHAIKRNISYNSNEGRLRLNSSEEGQYVIVTDPDGNVIYQGMLPDNYQDVLPERAIRLIDAFRDSRKFLEQDPEDAETEIILTDEAIDPVTMLLN